MEQGEDGERRIQDNEDLKQIEEGLRLLELTEEIEYSVKSEESRQEGPGIFPDHPDFVTLPIEIPDTQIVQSPHGRQKNGEEHGDSHDDHKPSELKLPRGREPKRCGCRSRHRLKDREKLCSEQKADADPLKRTKEPVLHPMKFEILLFLYLNEGALLSIERASPASQRWAITDTGGDTADPRSERI